MPRHIGVDRGIAIGGIEQMPVSGRKFGHEGKHRIAKDSGLGHGSNFLKVKEAVSFGVICFPRDDGRNEDGDQTGVHLPVTIHLYDHVRTRLDRGAVTCHHCSANALVLRVAQDNHPGIGAILRDHIPAAIRAAVIHREDGRDFHAYVCDHLQNVAGNAVAGNDHGDFLVHVVFDD